MDFALHKLASSESESLTSMHYDTRWTHEEMSCAGWLPRHDRDKKRIIAEQWQRSLWGGWS